MQQPYGLILSRHRGEAVVCQCQCGCRLVVRVAEVVGDKARLGFLAEREAMDVKREEITEGAAA